MHDPNFKHSACFSCVNRSTRKQCNLYSVPELKHSNCLAFASPGAAASFGADVASTNPGSAGSEELKAAGGRPVPAQQRCAAHGESPARPLRRCCRTGHGREQQRDGVPPSRPSHRMLQSTQHCTRETPFILRLFTWFRHPFDVVAKNVTVLRESSATTNMSVPSPPFLG